MNLSSALFGVMLIFLISSCSNNNDPHLVFVKGGNLQVGSKTLTVNNFYIGKYEVTQKEWEEVMGYNPSQFKGENSPVEMVSWYECIEYCNKRSIKEGLQPYYSIDSTRKDSTITNVFDSIRWTVSINVGANGYRLPTAEEWEYAARGGRKSKKYIYSGSDNIDEVAWYWRNSGNKYLKGFWAWSTIVDNKNSTKPVGLKKPNELGIFDMSGNVREWCWDMEESKGVDDFQGRIWKGGGWMGAEFCCEPSFHSKIEGSAKGPDQGFRVVRDIK